MGKVVPLGTAWQAKDTIYSLGSQYEGKNGLDFFPMKGKIYGPEAKKDGMEAIVLEKQSM